MFNFYNKQLLKLIKEFPQLPIVTFPGNNSKILSLDFSGLSKITQYNQAYQLYKYILAKYAFINLKYTNSYLIKINNIEFYLIYSPINIKIENNINETASLIVRLYLIQQEDNNCYFNIYSSCVLLPVDMHEYFGKF